ncbi:hypothetical protein JTL32_06360 [Enterobacter cloacae]|nr:hypothetical protein [Enterobacter cloacae]
MMKFKLFLASFSYLFFTNLTYAEYYNEVNYKTYYFRLNKEKKGSIDIRDSLSGLVNNCEISGWSKLESNGAGVMSLTSDKIGMLISPGNKYLLLKDVIECKGGKIPLRSLTYFEDDISTPIDVNFNKKIILATIPIDAQQGIFQSVISYFGGESNILSGSGFWDVSKTFVDEQGNTFSVGESIYLGKISIDGKYVSPNDLDCSMDSLPGVWDIERKMKVAFPEDKDDSVIYRKCKELFSGKKTLNELGGKLIITK